MAWVGAAVGWLAGVSQVGWLTDVIQVALLGMMIFVMVDAGTWLGTEV